MYLRRTKKELAAQPTLQPKAKTETGSAAPKKSDEHKQADKPPKLGPDRQGWSCENFVGKPNNLVTVDIPVPDNPEVALKNKIRIVDCKYCVVNVPWKASTIIVLNCSNVVVVFKALVASFDINESKKCTAQLEDTIGSVNVEKTNGFTFYLSKNSLETPFYTSRVLEMNIVVPADCVPENKSKKENERDPKELAVPCVFTTTIDPVTLRMKTVPAESAGSS